jgi:hypothetical protein
MIWLDDALWKEWGRIDSRGKYSRRKGLWEKIYKRVHGLGIPTNVNPTSHPKQLLSAYVNGFDVRDNYSLIAKHSKSDVWLRECNFYFPQDERYRLLPAKVREFMEAYKPLQHMYSRQVLLTRKNLPAKRKPSNMGHWLTTSVKKNRAFRRITSS